MRPKLAVAGYLSLDRISCPAGIFKDVVGGGALYAALGAAAAGADVTLVARVGDDFPSWALEGLAGLGIRLDALERVAGPTRRSELLESDAGPGHQSQRRTPAYGDARWWQRTRALAPVPLDAPVDAYLITAMPAAVARAHARGARHHGSLVVADTSEAFARNEPEAVLALAGEVDLFAPSREEVRLLVPGEIEADAHAQLAARAPMVLEKRGADGHWLSVRDRPRVAFASRATSVADTTGAGDASVGAFTAALARGLTPATALEIAALIAARTVAAVGPAGLGLAAPALV